MKPGIRFWLLVNAAVYVSLALVALAGGDADLSAMLGFIWMVTSGVCALLMVDD